MLAPLREGGSAEEQHLYEMCRRAIEAGHPDRVEIFGFARRDIIEYLPVDRLVPGATTWAELTAAWDRSLSFKQWLRKQQGAKISVEQLRRAARSIDYVPNEFTELAALCAEPSRNRHSAS